MPFVFSLLKNDEPKVNKSAQHNLLPYLRLGHVRRGRFAMISSSPPRVLQVLAMSIIGIVKWLGAIISAAD